MISFVLYIYIYKVYLEVYPAQTSISEVWRSIYIYKVYPEVYPIETTHELVRNSPRAVRNFPNKSK